MTARIARFTGPGQPLEVISWPLPEALEPGALLVRIDLAAVCGSDLHTTLGRRPEKAPSTLGHEGIGFVEASARHGVRPGDRVTWSLVDSCGSCPACTAWDLPQKCERLFKYGHGGPGLDGTYATHVVARPGTAVFALPSGLDPRLAAAANCALATSVEGLRDLGAPEKALVLGGGMVGLFAALLLDSQGWEVVVVDGNPGRRDLAAMCGLAARPSCEGQAGLVFEASGSAALLHSSYPCLRPGGSLRLIGLTHPESELGLSAEDIIRRCWRIAGSHNYRPSSLAEALDKALILQARLPLDLMFGAPWPLDDVNLALEETRQKRHVRSLIAPQMQRP